MAEVCQYENLQRKHSEVIHLKTITLKYDELYLILHPLNRHRLNFQYGRMYLHEKALTNTTSGKKLFKYAVTAKYGPLYILKFCKLLYVTKSQHTDLYKAGFCYVHEHVYFLKLLLNKVMYKYNNQNESLCTLS